eukprot:COSAG03_NODE_1639_length_3730_cov_8.308455_2_plen_451_part_00
MVQLDLHALWLSRGNSVRVRVDGGEETLLLGTVLPPPESGGRSFRSKAAGNVTVLIVTSELTSLSFVSLAVRAVCVAAGGCGSHGDCVGGSCRCSDRYSGSGALFPSFHFLVRAAPAAGSIADKNTAHFAGAGCQCPAGLVPGAASGCVKPLETSSMTVWNRTVNFRSTAGPCPVPSPVSFAYPGRYRVQPMTVFDGFSPAVDAWTEGKDDVWPPMVSAKYVSGALLPDRRVVPVPSMARRVGLYNLSKDAWSEASYEGGVLLPDGRVVLVPDTANHVGLYNPSTDAWSEGKDDLSGVYDPKYAGGVLLPDGRVVLVPYGAFHVGLYDPSTDTWSKGKDDISAAGFYLYIGGVLLPDGRVVLVPLNANHVGLYDPSTDAWSEGRDDLSRVGSDKYAGGVLLPDGRVVLVPDGAEHIGLYDGGGPRNDPAYTLPALSPAMNALLLPYYNKL